jgi:hypothetical protein
VRPVAREPRREALDDLVFAQLDAARLEDAGGVPEAGADQLHAVVDSPDSPEGGDQLDLCREPVGLRVDEGAVHVPENGGGAGGGHNRQSYG